MKRKATKQTEAAERQEYWDSLSSREKLADLDSRLGENVGALKQRVSLLADASVEKALIYAVASGAGESVIAKLKERLENERANSESS